MAVERRRSKAPEQISSKRVHAQKRVKSVIDVTLLPQSGSQKRDRPGAVTDAHAKLAPWLALANGESDGAVRLRSNSVLNLTGSPDTLRSMQSSAKAWFECVLQMREYVFSRDPGILERFRGIGRQMGPALSLPAFDAGVFSTDLGELAVDVNGVLQETFDNPRAAFIQALAGAEIDRFRQCTVCSHFYYARRNDQKACGTRCANVIRARNFRARQEDYEYNRKLVGAGLRPKRGSR